MSSTALVVTTIFEPAFLRGYLDSLRAAGRETEVTLYVIGDRKTPARVWEACLEAGRAGFQIDCPTLDEQTEYLRKRGVPDDFIPWDSDNRRNIGFLRALEAGCETLISIDDDNHCVPDSDFAGEHRRVLGEPVSEPAVTGSDGWFNICGLMESSIPGEVFARGFPYAAQRAERVVSTRPASGTRVAVNAGLWLDDPDVDAVCRLGQHPKFPRWTGKSAVLAGDTWSPINTQNTALTREAALTYYYVRMGFPVKGLSIDRYGDILSGYFTQKCVKHMGQAVRFGGPIVEHRRTVHNLFKDLYHELAGMVLIEELVPWLREVPLSGSTMSEAYASLAEALLENVHHFRGFLWDDGGREFLVETARRMQTWLSLQR